MCYACGVAYFSVILGSLQASRKGCVSPLGATAPETNLRVGCWRNPVGPKRDSRPHLAFPRSGDVGDPGAGSRISEPSASSCVEGLPFGRP